MSKENKDKSIEVLEEARKILCDYFDCGLVVVSWEESGTTFSAHMQFGNSYAIDSIKKNIEAITGPNEEESEEEVEA